MWAVRDGHLTVQLRTEPLCSFLGLATTLDPVAYTSLAAVRTTSSTSAGFESMGTWLLSTS